MNSTDRRPLDEAILEGRHNELAPPARESVYLGIRALAGALIMLAPALTLGWTLAWDPYQTKIHPLNAVLILLMSPPAIKLALAIGVTEVFSRTATALAFGKTYTWTLLWIITPIVSLVILNKEFDLASEATEPLLHLEEPALQKKTLTPVKKPQVSECPEGQVLRDGACQGILCPDGYVLNEGVCRSQCPDGYDRVDGECFLRECPAGQEPRGGMCSPLECPAGQEVRGGMCRPLECPAGQEVRGDECRAIECPGGQVLVGAVCEPAPCVYGQRLKGDRCVPICARGMAYIAGGQDPGTDPWDGERGLRELVSLCMDITEVTVAAYKQCVDRGKCTIPNPDEVCNWDSPGRDAHPINCVEYEQARAYCRSVSKRLPTIAEWEWAAQGREEGRPYPWGARSPACSLTAMTGCSTDYGSSPVGSKPAGASRDGLLDMSGNVFEWTTGTGSSGNHVYCGGSWDAAAVKFQAAVCTGRTGSWRDDVGFRCVRTVHDPR